VINRRRRAIVGAVLLSCLVVAGTPVHGAAQKSKVQSMKDAETYHKAMDFFKKAEAMIGTDKENSDEQATLFRQAVEIYPAFLEAHFNLGLIYSNQKKSSESVVEFEAVRKLNPDFEGVHQLLASAYSQLGNLDGAMSVLQQGLEKKPRDLKMLTALAYLQYNAKNDAAAVETLKRILELSPEDLDALTNLALLYQRNNQVSEAIDCYRQIARLDPKHLVAHNNLSIIYMNQKRYPEAVEETEAANMFSPGNPDILQRMGDAYALQLMHAKAAQAYQSALEHIPADDSAVRGEVYSKLGFSLANLNRNAEAVSALENSIGLNPKNAAAFFLLGDLYSELKRVEESIAAYKQSLVLDPKQKEVHYNLGTVYAEKGTMDDAAAELRVAVELDPAYASAWANLALVAEKMGTDSEAIKAREKVVSLGKSPSINYFRLGILYAKNNQVDQAIDSLGKAIALEPDKYRQILREELKNVHSVLDSIRYKEKFTRLLTGPPPSESLGNSTQKP
jgi:tetratricopeptide (TPR) repeat protein